MRKLILLSLLMALSGCFFTKNPLFTPDDAVTPLPSRVAIYNEKENDYMLFEQRKRNVYSVLMEKDRGEFIFIPIPGLDNHFHLQEYGEKKDQYIHQLVSINGHEYILYNVNVEKVIENFNLHGFEEHEKLGWTTNSPVSALTMYKAALGDSSTNIDGVALIYDLDNAEQASQFSKIVELIKLKEKQKTKEADKTKQTSKPISNYNPDIWKNTWTVSDNNVRRLLKSISPIEGTAKLEDGMQSDSLKLPFYKNVSLIRVHNTWSPKNLFLYFLYDGQTLTQLDGKSPPIHKFNGAHKLYLNESTVSSYLWFFSFFVRAEEGPFLVVNSPNDTFLPKDVKDTNNKGIEHLIRPARCQQTFGSKNYGCSAIVYYSNAVFEVQFKIEPSGMVSMVDDKPVAADLSSKIFAPVSVREVASSFVQSNVTKKQTQSLGSWVFNDGSSSSKTRRYLTLPERGSTNTYSKTMLRVTCMSDGMDVEVMWGAPMKNMYPNESVPTATRVSAQFGDSAVWNMGWQPSSDGFITRAPGVQLDVASGVDSFMFSLLGMESISKKNKEMFNWTAEQFVNRIASQAHSSSENHFLRLSAKNTSNSKLTLEFDLTGFNELANQHFKGVCIN